MAGLDDSAVRVCIDSGTPCCCYKQEAGTCYFFQQALHTHRGVLYSSYIFTLQQFDSASRSLGVESNI